MWHSAICLALASCSPSVGVDQVVTQPDEATPIGCLEYVDLVRSNAPRIAETVHDVASALADARAEFISPEEAADIVEAAGNQLVEIRNTFSAHITPDEFSSIGYEHIAPTLGTMAEGLYSLADSIRSGAGWSETLEQLDLANVQLDRLNDIVDDAGVADVASLCEA